MKKWLSSNKKLGFFLTVSLLATSTGFVLQQVHEQQLRTAAASDLLYSYNFSDGGSSNSTSYTATGVSTDVSYDSDNPSGAGTTTWLADWANLNLSNGTRLGGKAASLVQYDSTPWANIRTDFAISSAIEKVELIGCSTFGTASKVHDVYLQSTTGTTWANQGTPAAVTATIVFDNLSIPAGSYIRIGVTKDDTGGTNSGLNFTGLKVYKPQAAPSGPLTNLTYTGTLTNPTQNAGDSFDPSGLTFTAQFGSGTSATYQDVTSSVTFTNDPLVAGDTSVTASYTYDGVTKTTTVTGLTVVANPFKTGTYTLEGKAPLTNQVVTPTGNVPTGSTGAFTTTYGTNINQMTKDNSQLLALTGYQNTQVTEITLNMRSNANGGAGKFEYSFDNSSWVAIIPTSNFNNANWNGAYTSSYVDIVKTVTIDVPSAGNLYLKISATVNSLYCQSFSVKWRSTGATDATLTGISVTTAPTVNRYIIGQTFNPSGLVVQASYDDGTFNNDFQDYTLSIPDGQVLNTLGTNITVTVTAASNTSLTDTFTIIEVSNPDAILVGSGPTKTTYTAGESLDLTGLKINTYAGTWGEFLNTSRYTTNPAAGAFLNTTGTITVTVTSTDVSTLTTTFTVTVNPLSYTPSGSPLVISEVYGGGGNTGSIYSNDFVELYNATESPINLSGYSIQYAGANSNFSSGNTLLLSGYIPAKAYFLIELDAGFTPSNPLPTPDQVGTIAVGAAGGKVALVNGTTVISGILDASIVDFVGFGGANESEGTSAPAPSNTKSVARILDPSTHEPVDSNDNSFDFQATENITPYNTQESFYDQFMAYTTGGAICTAADWGYIDDNYNCLTSTAKSYFASKADAVARHNYLVGVNANLPALDIALLSLVNSLVTPNSLETITVVVITLAGINLLAYFYFVKRKRRYLN